MSSKPKRLLKASSLVKAWFSAAEQVNTADFSGSLHPLACPLPLTWSVKCSAKGCTLYRHHQKVVKGCIFKPPPVVGVTKKCERTKTFRFPILISFTSASTLTFPSKESFRATRNLFISSLVLSIWTISEAWALTGFVAGVKKRWPKYFDFFGLPPQNEWELKLKKLGRRVFFAMRGVMGG